MELTKDWGDMVVLASTSQETSSSVLNGLKLAEGCAVSSPLDRSKRFTLSSPGRPVHSDTNSTSLGSILATKQLRANTIFTHISAAVYNQVLIYTADWTEASWRERKCPNFEMVSTGGFEPGLA